MTNRGFDSPTPPSTAPPPSAEPGTGARQEGGIGEQVQQGLEQAKEVAGQVGEQLTEKTQELRGQAQQRIREQVDTRSTAAGDQMAATAAAARDASSKLREQGQDLPAQIVEQMARRTEQLGEYLRGASAEKLLGDIEDMGRRQPWAVIAGGIAAGFLGARFLKASSRDRYQQRFVPPPRATTAPPMAPPAHAMPGEAALSGTATPGLPRQSIAPEAPSTPLPSDVGAV